MFFIQSLWTGRWVGGKAVLFRFSGAEIAEIQEGVPSTPLRQLWPSPSHTGFFSGDVLGFQQLLERRFQRR
jgi:hypothetical protein